MENDNEFEGIRSLEPAEVQEIIDWAVSASALVVLMTHSPEHTNEAETAERLDGFLQALQIMVDNLPASLVEPAHVVAAEAVNDAEHEQELVDQFLDEMKDL